MTAGASKTAADHPRRPPIKRCFALRAPPVGLRPPYAARSAKARARLCRSAAPGLTGQPAAYRERAGYRGRCGVQGRQSVASPGGVPAQYRPPGSGTACGAKGLASSLIARPSKPAVLDRLIGSRPLGAARLRRRSGGMHSARTLGHHPGLVTRPVEGVAFEREVTIATVSGSTPSVEIR
jgi:hypothetical protein